MKNKCSFYSFLSIVISLSIVVPSFAMVPDRDIRQGHAADTVGIQTSAEAGELAVTAVFDDDLFRDNSDLSPESEQICLEIFEETDPFVTDQAEAYLQDLLDTQTQNSSMEINASYVFRMSFTDQQAQPLIPADNRLVSYSLSTGANDMHNSQVCLAGRMDVTEDGSIVFLNDVENVFLDKTDNTICFDAVPAGWIILGFAVESDSDLKNAVPEGFSSDSGEAFSEPVPEERDDSSAEEKDNDAEDISDFGAEPTEPAVEKTEETGEEEAVTDAPAEETVPEPATGPAEPAVEEMVETREEEAETEAPAEETVPEPGTEPAEPALEETEETGEEEAETEAPAEVTVPEPGTGPAEPAVQETEETGEEEAETDVPAEEIVSDPGTGPAEPAMEETGEVEAEATDSAIEESGTSGTQISDSAVEEASGGEAKEVTTALESTDGSTADLEAENAPQSVIDTDLSSISSTKLTYNGKEQYPEILVFAKPLKESSGEMVSPEIVSKDSKTNDSKNAASQGKQNDQPGADGQNEKELSSGNQDTTARRLEEGVDYVVSYHNQRTGSDQPVDAGVIEVTVKGVGKCIGEITGTYEITPLNINLFETVTEDSPSK